jgi:hypothetical protein
MAIGFVMTFDGVGQDDYERVMAAGNLDLPSPGNPDAGGKWPEGLVLHHAGPTPTGWCVVDIWESEEAVAAFGSARLDAALERERIPQPDVVTFPVYNAGP